MLIQPTTWRGRRGWVLDNGSLRLVLLQTGGHLASLTDREDPDLNPYWVPHWNAVEPPAYRTRHETRYGDRLLAAITGHNLCLPWFGEPSESERLVGLGLHGEAPVARWRMLKSTVGPQRIKAVFQCAMPASGMSLTRTLTMRRGGDTIRVGECLRNLNRRDIPYAWCQHVTVGAPFLEKGRTVVDMPALQGHTFPGDFGRPQRLQSAKSFRWPRGPGQDGRPVDLRMLERRYRTSSDYYALRMDPHRDGAWFSVMHPGRRRLLAYLWQRTDFPWVGAWEENYGRKNPPWDGVECARGLEFTTTPFPEGLRAAAGRGTLDGEPTLRWLPARATVQVAYTILWRSVAGAARAVASITPAGRGGVEVQWR